MHGKACWLIAYVLWENFKKMTQFKMVSLDVYSDKIKPLKFLISYINIIILQAWKVVRSFCILNV